MAHGKNSSSKSTGKSGQSKVSRDVKAGEKIDPIDRSSAREVATSSSSSSTDKAPIAYENTTISTPRRTKKRTEITTPKASKTNIPVNDTPTKKTPDKSEDLDSENKENTPGAAFTAGRNIYDDRRLSSPVKLDLQTDDDLIIRPKKSTVKSTSTIKPKVIVPADVKEVYKMVTKRTGNIGGNGSTGAIYGELTIGSMHKILTILVEKCELTHKSRFIDVGAGLGKPNLHAAQHPKVRLSLGIELEKIRWQLSMFNLSYILQQIVEGKSTIAGSVNFIESDIDVADSTDPFTHIYMYDLGFPPPLQQSIARKFNESVHATYLVSYRPPHRVINEYMYEVELVDQVPTSMHGSGEIHTAYIYRRVNTPRKILPSDNKIIIPARDDFDEEDESVVCDPLFEEAIQLAVGDIKLLYNHVKSVSADHLSAGRPSRDRKPKKLI